MAHSCRTSSPDFDFLMGIWSVHHRYRARRLQDCHDWLEFRGTSCARKILEGFGNMDEVDIALPGDPYRGMSVRTWDPDKKRWYIRWFDSRHPGHAFPPVVGGFDKGTGTFLGDDALKGHPIRVRFLWSHVTQKSARWEQAFSPDAGNSWETNWVMDFTRM